MQKRNANKYWVPDNQTYSQLQQLTEFADFVASTKFATNANKTEANQIKALIKNINNPASFKSWSLSFDIYDNAVQNREREGIYWRKWCVSFENGLLEISAGSKDLDEFDYSPQFYQFTGSVNFIKAFTGQRVNLPIAINNFIADARNYKNYITETLNEIEVDILIW